MLLAPCDRKIQNVAFVILWATSVVNALLFYFRAAIPSILYFCSTNKLSNWSPFSSKYSSNPDLTRKRRWSPFNIRISSSLSLLSWSYFWFSWTVSEDCPNILRPLLNGIGKLCVKKTGFSDNERIVFSVTFWVFFRFLEHFDFKSHQLLSFLMSREITDQYCYGWY